jgi:hypothetical protein
MAGKVKSYDAVFEAGGKVIAIATYVDGSRTDLYECTILVQTFEV